MKLYLLFFLVALPLRVSLPAKTSMESSFHTLQYFTKTNLFILVDIFSGVYLQEVVHCCFSFRMCFLWFSSVGYLPASFRHFLSLIQCPSHVQFPFLAFPFSPPSFSLCSPSHFWSPETINIGLLKAIHFKFCVIKVTYLFLGCIIMVIAFLCPLFCLG